MKTQQFEISVGEQTMRAEFSDLALRANGSVVLSMGDTQVMAVVVMGGESPYRDGGLALRVDYEERYYARGAILGSRYNKREGKPSTEATLTARLIDRSIRPYFPEGFNKEVQVVVTVLGLGEYDPDMLAVNAAALALHTSDIPWAGPLACVRISQTNDEKPVINPTFEQLRSDDNHANSIMAGSKERLCMIELDGAEVANSSFEAMCAQALELTTKVSEQFETIRKKVGSKKQEFEPKETNELLAEVFDTQLRPPVSASLESLLEKETVAFWKANFKKAVRERDETNQENTDVFFDHAVKEMVRESIVADHQRLDKRGLTAVRPLYAQAGMLTGKQHGSGVFYRGDTHVLSVLTMGSLEDDVLHHQEMEVEGTQRFMHYYNFPDYSVGEVGRMGSPRRREIGHGALASKALERVLPSGSDFPYALRVVSEVMSSNGSTSMASVCASSLALMDGGVPLTKHVAGVACGLVEASDQAVILTDILGIEDFYGDMDFKIAGTKDGITAIQLDCKNRGITQEIITATLEQSTPARMQIIAAMDEALAEPRALSPYVERILTYQIPEDKIGLVIGKGGVTIKRITKESGAQVNIKRDGTAYITGNDQAPQKAQTMIEEIINRAD